MLNEQSPAVNVSTVQCSVLLCSLSPGKVEHSPNWILVPTVTLSGWKELAQEAHCQQLHGEKSELGWAGFLGRVMVSSRIWYREPVWSPW